jgi:hypothetical protein
VLQRLAWLIGPEKQCRCRTRTCCCEGCGLHWAEGRAGHPDEIGGAAIAILTPPESYRRAAPASQPLNVCRQFNTLVSNVSAVKQLCEPSTAVMVVSILSQVQTSVHVL